MKTVKVKYTVEFDIPVASETSIIQEKQFVGLESLLEQAVKIQTFYFKTPPDTKFLPAKPVYIKAYRETSVM
jgi:hypothetical protein